MKRFKQVIVLIGFGLLISGTQVNAQKVYEDPKFGADSATRVNCQMNLSVMGQYVKVKTFEYALDPWRDCFINCPKSSKNIYIHGTKIMEHYINQSQDEAAKNAYIDTLMMVYDKRIEHFGQEGYVLGKKGIDLLKYRKEELETAYGYLEKSLDLRKSKTDASVVVTYMTATNALYKSGKVEADVMIGNYLKAMEALEGMKPGSKTNKATESVEDVFAKSGAANAEALVDIFTPKYEANPNDVELLKKITELLDMTPNGDETELFAKASESLYPLEPSPKAAANLAKLFTLKEEFDKAEEYYLKAIESETDNLEKAEYYYLLGFVDFKQNQYANARKNAKSAIDLNPEYGDAYILIGNAYAASAKSCGATPFEQNSVYWAAVDKFAKAKSVDASVAEKANEMINRYSKYFPNNEEAFFVGFSNGDSYTVGCWINEKTIVRTTKN